MTAAEELILRIFSQLSPSQAHALVAWIQGGGFRPLLDWKQEKDGERCIVGLYTLRVWRDLQRERVWWGWDICKYEGKYLRRSAYTQNDPRQEAERAFITVLIDDMNSLEESVKRQSALTSGLRVVK